MLLTKPEIIKKLCDLCTHVNSKVFDYTLATDCFCDKPEDENYRFNQEVLEFIRQAVSEKISKEGSNG